jgi:hypothetical protein
VYSLANRWWSRWDAADAAVESVHSREFPLHYNVDSFCASEIVTLMSRSLCEYCSRVWHTDWPSTLSHRITSKDSGRRRIKQKTRDGICQLCWWRRTLVAILMTNSFCKMAAEIRFFWGFTVYFQGWSKIQQNVFFGWPTSLKNATNTSHGPCTMFKLDNIQLIWNEFNLENYHVPSAWVKNLTFSQKEKISKWLQFQTMQKMLIHICNLVRCNLISLSLSSKLHHNRMTQN